jgi:uncharacterized cupin superfamily protein
MKPSSPPRIVSFRDPVERSETAPAADRLLGDAPRQLIENHYAEGTGQFFSGVWSSTPGKWRVSYTEHEFCHLLCGSIAIESDAGERYRFAAGDSFVIPSGFSGTWEVLEDVRKLYAIFEPSR